MKVKGFLIFPSIIFILSSCSHKINPERPVLSQTDFKLDSLPNSEINIPVQINLKPLYEMAEKNVDTVYTSPNYPDDWVLDGCNTRYKYVFRRGPLQIKASGTSFLLGFTGFYKIIGSTRACIKGTVLSPWTPPCKCGFNEPERKVNVSFSNSLIMLPDYKIKLNIKRNEPQPLDKCEVCFWGQDITKVVLKELATELDAAKENMQVNYGLIDLRSRFQQLWDQLNKGYDIYGLGWLQINPQKIRINNFYAQNDSLNIYFGVSAKPVISFEKPENNNSIVPNITSFGRQQGFNIFLDAVLNYDSLSDVLNQQLSGKQINLNKGPLKKTFIVRNCELYGAGNEKLIVKVSFSGTDNGVIYFTGKPVYNKETHVIEVKDIEFDIRSQNALLKTADWLFNKKISNEIAKYSRFDLGPYIDSVKMQLNRELNNEWVKGVRSYGNIDHIDLEDIYPANRFLIIRTNCTGELSIKMDSIGFSL